MDPVTAIFNFLCTPVGQKIVDQVDSAILHMITDLVQLVHDQQQLDLENKKVVTKDGMGTNTSSGNK